MKFYTAQVILAIDYLHSLDVVHADISTKNICIDHQGYAKLIDFGLAKSIHGKIDERAGLCKRPDFWTRLFFK